MKIHNIRYGLATNSSSTHSIIFRKGLIDEYCEDYSFGWKNFVAASQETKEQYLANILYDNCIKHFNYYSAKETEKAKINKEIIKLIFQVLPNTKLEINNNELYVKGYIDHQSVYNIPVIFNDNNQINLRFFNELKDFILKDNVCILGGNDNDEDFDKDNNAFNLILEKDSDDKLVARKDNYNNYWSVFNKKTGKKIRFSFEKPSSEKIVDKAFAPELVDIKITDYCPFNCDFCYQGSTINGKHCDIKTIENIANVFSQLQVFEVALGGGEPTLHPEFINILKIFNEKGIVPNFTTKNLSWIKNKEIADQILNLCGAFAYSVENANQINSFAKLCTNHKINNRKIYIQYVMGVNDNYKEVLEATGKNYLKITLLGFKTNNRGENYKQNTNYNNWIDVCNNIVKKYYTEIGIDTMLANQFQQQLKDNNINNLYYQTQEGKFSMYVDAVDNKIAASSYVNNIAMKRINLQEITKEDVLKEFAKY